MVAERLRVSRRVDHRRRPPQLDTPPTAPLPLAILFVALVVYAGRLGNLAASVLLALAVVQMCRPDSAYPRNAGARVTGVLLVVVGFQVLLELLRGDGDDAMLLNLRPVYSAGFAFGTYALFRRWEQRAGRASVIRSATTAVERSAPFVVTLIVVFALGLTFAPWFAEAMPWGIRSLVSEGAAVIAAPLTFLFPIVTSRRSASVNAHRRLALIILWAIGATVFAFEGRTVALSIGVGLLCVYVNAANIARAAYALAVILALLWVSGATVSVGQREISYQAATEYVASVVGSEDDDTDVSRTRGWRIETWSKIMDDARDGPFVLSGHGWNVSLNEEYLIFPVPGEGGTLRHAFPHNLFMTLTALGGLGVAVTFLAVPLLTILRRTRDIEPDDFTIIKAARAALITSVVASMFGVVVERPEGGSLFWILIGFIWWATATATPKQLAVSGPGHHPADRPKTSMS